MGHTSLVIFFLVTVLYCGAGDVVQQSSEFGTSSSPVKVSGVEAEGDVPWELNRKGSNDTVGVATLTTKSDEEVILTDAKENWNITEISPSLTTILTQNVTVAPELTTEINDTTTDAAETSSGTTDDAFSTPTSPEWNTTTTEEETISTSEVPFLPVKEGGLATWALITVALLISFAIILTGLSFLRRYLIRRRREDQRKLLRSTASSEGFFYGDGTGSTHSARFHDSI